MRYATITLAGLALLVALVGAPRPASAQQITMDRLLALCAGTEPVADAPKIGQFACSHYLAGLVDAWWGLMNYIGQRAFCLPETGLGSEDVFKIAQEWAKAHPEYADAPAHPQLFNALRDAFPCAGQGRPAQPSPVPRQQGQ